MIKISALNEQSEEDRGSEEDVTREASEQIALQQYANALELRRKGNLKDATQLLNNLLDIELLCDKEVDAAIEAYCAAAEQDDTDVTLWHRLGQVCMRAKRYEMALHAFQRGVDRDPHHWPCLDKVVTLLLGLDYKEECITTIHDALQLDPEYMRGLAYRKHIFTVYPDIRDFMEYLNPIYKWNEKEDELIDKEKAEKLIKEADKIKKIFLEQQRAEQFKYVLPELKLVKPITNLNWRAVGDSLVHMHHHMSEHYYNHTSKIEIIFEKEETMEVCEEPKEVEPEENKIEEAVPETERNAKKVSENESNELSDTDKAGTDTEKIESDVNHFVVAESAKAPSDIKVPKKGPVRRRGSALSFPDEDGWATKKSGQKKPVSKQEQSDNICEALRKMVPVSLVPEMVEKKENQARETSPDTSDLDELFEEKEKLEEQKEYFGSENEQLDVKNFINQHRENKRDIIDILKDYLSILAVKWREKWPQGLPEVFIEANKCFLNHIDVPTCTSDNDEELLHYTTVNILVEEFSVNEKFNTSSPIDDMHKHDLNVIETIGITLSLKPHIFESTECLELTLRYLWVKLHIQLLNKCNEFALDCLHQLQYKFEAMGEHHDTYNLNIVNFTFKPTVNENEVLAGVKFLERYKKLSTVMESYERGNYEEVLSIVIDTFEHCKTMARNEEEVPLDFAVHLSVILDTYWALDKPDECFKWSLTCLHEALEHYFRFTAGSKEYDKWTLTVVKILVRMEHILTTGLTCLDTVSQKELSQGLEDLIRVVGHQVETNASEMPFGTVIPWIVVHYILQREEDREWVRTEKEKVACDEVPNPLMVLFMAHEQLGKRGWCCKSEAKLLYFTLDTVVPGLRSPSLAKCLDQVVQYMKQCVYCLFGHPGRKKELIYLVNHKVKSSTLDWKRAQQLYEIFRPPMLPPLLGKLPGITADDEQLFHKILELLPPECDAQKYLPEIDKFIKGLEDKLPYTPSLLPYKMKDIYFLLGDYYFKKKRVKLCMKFNMLDIAVNNDRAESWARISVEKACNCYLKKLEKFSCKNLINYEVEYLNPAKSVLRCFKRSMDLDPTPSYIWMQYGLFAYAVQSFCSRVLKQASKSLSMKDFESLEKQKEDMLDTTQKCFTNVLVDPNSRTDDESWLFFYMLGKVDEKRNKPPSVYLDYYMKAVKSLKENGATYSVKINYNTPLSTKGVFEVHYRIHASILKYIEQHENEPIPASVGKVFLTCIEEWKKGPFIRKPNKDGAEDIETNTEPIPAELVHPANILKRSISDAGEEESHEVKRLKMAAAAAKVRKYASYDTERTPIEPIVQSAEVTDAKPVATAEENIQEVVVIDDKSQQPTLPSPPPPLEPFKQITPEIEQKSEEKKDETDTEKKEDSSSSSSDRSSDSSSDSDTSKSSNDSKPLTDEEIMKIVSDCLDALEDCASRFTPHYKAIYRLAHYHFYYKKGKDIERCRDLMLSNFTSSSGQKLGGLFSERKPFNFFNKIWIIPGESRPCSPAFHITRSVLLTMEILKEINDHKTLLDLSLHLQIPSHNKIFIRGSDREELASEAFTLCVQSVKRQLNKFSQQADLKSNEVERHALNSLMLDIYRAYQIVAEQLKSKQFTNLLIEGYKLATCETIAENSDLVCISLTYCRRLIQKQKHEANMSSSDKIQNAKKKQAAKAAVAKTVKVTTSTVTSLQKPEQKTPQPSTSTALYRQFLGQSFSSSFMPPAKKQKRGPKPGSVRPPANQQMKASKSFTAPTMPPVTKATPMTVTTKNKKKKPDAKKQLPFTDRPKPI